VGGGDLMKFDIPTYVAKEDKWLYVLFTSWIKFYMPYTHFHSMEDAYKIYKGGVHQGIAMIQ
jgi:hypothetical protein